MDDQRGPQPLPALDLIDLDGEQWNASKFPKGVVLIEFWATWCAPCREIAPELHAFYNQKMGQVRMLSISLDESRNLVDWFVAEHPFPNPVAYGGPKLANQWDISQIPALVFIKDGKILTKWQGKERVRDALQTLRIELK